MKLNKKGFTLIELLAVITIMGILMMVAIPAVSRTIENSRRDTFRDLVKTYVNTVRNAVIADELECNGKSVGSTTAGSYYFVMATDSSALTEASQTLDLMESGGKSSWGNNDVVGIVAWRKVANTGVTSGFKTTYYAFLVDSANHGLPSLLEENNIVRSKVLANTSSIAAYADVDTKTELLAKIAGLTKDSGNNDLAKDMDTALVFTGDTSNMTECTLNQ